MFAEMFSTFGLFRFSITAFFFLFFSFWWLFLCAPVTLRGGGALCVTERGTFTQTSFLPHLFYLSAADGV